MIFNSAILVLLYGCQTNHSVTLNKLKELKDLNLKSMHLTIWNNGPESIEINIKPFLSLGLNVAVKETLHNESLAIIYNDFIKHVDSKRYIILDHDSNITNEYLSDIDKIKEDNIGVPLISSLGLSRSPTIKGVPISDINVKLNENVKVIAIGSGVVIGREVVKKFISKLGTVFDERFYLYGVDTSFFYRFNYLFPNENIIIMNGFDHSLSRLENENYTITEFRKTERSCDMALMYRYYTPYLKQIYFLCSITFKTLIKKVIGRELNLNYSIFLMVYLKGRHYRDCK